MNRQQRRKAVQEKQVNMKLLKDVSQVTRDEAIKSTETLLIASTLIVLYDKHQFTAEQIKTVLDEIKSQCECIINKTVKLEDIKQIIRDEIGIDLEV